MIQLSIRESPQILRTPNISGALGFERVNLPSIGKPSVGGIPQFSSNVLNPSGDGWGYLLTK